ncbi:hypothetical protein OC835_006554 [Tilletia horrida]|nr:hypothetical protein OC835_006554 [Tilletia horrida]KAK0553357.1 hypothetical protein OC844_006302 [Tilletia horrida]
MSKRLFARESTGGHVPRRQVTNDQYNFQHAEYAPLMYHDQPHFPPPPRTPLRPPPPPPPPPLRLQYYQQQRIQRHLQSQQIQRRQQLQLQQSKSQQLQSQPRQQQQQQKQKAREDYWTSTSAPQAVGKSRTAAQARAQDEDSSDARGRKKPRTDHEPGTVTVTASSSSTNANLTGTSSDSSSNGIRASGSSSNWLVPGSGQESAVQSQSQAQAQALPVARSGTSTRHASTSPTQDLSAVEYAMATETWEGKIFTVRDRTGQILLNVPVEFLVRGKCDSVAYVLEQIHSCFHARGVLKAWSTDAPLVGEVSHLGVCDAVFERDDGKDDEPCRPKKGPRGNLSTRPPSDDDYFNGASALPPALSSTAPPASVAFQFAVVARDSTCLLSDAYHDECAAVHIAPTERPEYYDEALGRAAGNLNKAQFGLLLRHDLAQSFLAGKWALYPEPIDNNSLIVHFFDANNSGCALYHGRVIYHTRFRCRPLGLPSLELLRFHYAQCAMRRLRDTSAGF